MDTPLLFLIFNRPDTTKLVFEAIRRAKPKQLYIAADGPRADRAGEADLCAQTRKVAQDIDWPCEIHTLFREQNLGCKAAVASAIDWFFQNEEEGIILEDDTLPAQEFFLFCERMLAIHRDNPRVMMIAGFNPVGAGVKSPYYFLSHNPSIWGWACWRDRWAKYDIRMSSWPNQKIIKRLKYLPLYVREYFIDMFNRTKSGEINTWDYQWTYSIMENGGVTIKPVANLITNVGIDGAHTSSQTHNHFVEYGLLEPEKLKILSDSSLASQQDFACYEKMFGEGKARYLTKYLLRRLGLLRFARRLKLMRVEL